MYEQISSDLGLEPGPDCFPVRTKSNKVCCDVLSSQSGGMFRNRDTCRGSHSEPNGQRTELWRRQELERTRGGVDGREQPQSPRCTACGTQMHSKKLEENACRKKMCLGSRSYAIVQAWITLRSDWIWHTPYTPAAPRGNLSNKNPMGTAKSVIWSLA